VVKKGDMKIIKRFFSVMAVGLLGLTLGKPVSGWAQPASGSSERPTISAIQLEGTNVLVVVKVPAGLRRVTLEGRSRLGSGAWEPRVVSRLSGTGGEVTVRISRSSNIELLRVRADATEPLPAAFFQGTNAFAGPVSTSPPDPNTTLNPLTGAPTERSLDSGATASREVVESDIWKIQGNTLYFFNQYRGLQVIDIGNPDAPVVRGALDLPAAGEQMYLLDTNQVVLLARGNCYWSDSGNDSQVLLVAVSNGVPSISARLPVPGSISESRMVGTALYVASESYRVTTKSNTQTWEWGTVVSSFDLSNPAAPKARGTLWFSGYGNVIYATDQFLFVATQDAANWWQSIVRVIDISDPAGAMQSFASIRTAGRIADKFKMNLTGDILTAISEDWHWDNGTRLVTKLETFSLATSSTPLRLGQLELGKGERLHATRFDGNRVYVVTFFQIDPLFVVDLSSPASPRIAGQVDVPGWSTYIQPLGDRLVTIGVESNRVAVSLFDVADATKPALLDRERLGDNYSWSEANWDEKAFSVLPDDGLILVPYQGDTTNGYASRVQLIDLGADSLVVRGLIEHRMAPRRATVHNALILSLSGWELLTVDAADRDHPRVRSDTELAWPVDRVFLQGAYIIEVANGSSWDNSVGAVVRVASAADPNRILSSFSLTNQLPLAGATTRDGRLYLAQTKFETYGPLPLKEGDTNSAPATNGPNFFLSVLDLSALPDLRSLGSAQATLNALGWSASFQPLWVKSGLLVWSGGEGSFYRLALDTVRSAGVATDVAVPIGRGFWPGWYGGGGGRLIAFDVNDANAPKLISDVSLSETNRWGFSQPYSADGLVYLSHQNYDYVPPVITVDPKTGADVTNQPPYWFQRWYLDVVDYADAQTPTVRQPVNIPGALNGLSHNGAVLYTLGQHWSVTNATTWYTDWSEWLDASAYDGVAAHLIDSLQPPATWPHPVWVQGTNVFLGRPGESGTNATPNRLETWTLAPDTGKFTLAGATTLDSPVYLFAAFGDLLATQQSDQTISLFNASDGTKLRLLGKNRPDGCLGFDLKNAGGDVDRGLWIPLGSYGVFTIGVTP
jgi:hypothetical protein